MMKKNKEDMEEIVGKIRYKPGWELRLREEPGRFYLQWHFSNPDAKNPMLVTPVFGRKWFLSTWMTESEIVQTALMGALAAEEHECREFFRYEGKRVFNPHIDVRSLMEVCDREDGRD